jgi:ABC-type transporter Mla subunit MlaD
MATEESHVRLGVFVVIGLMVVLATALFFVQRVRSRAVISMVTYVTENVSGLDVSSPVRYRGVPVGRVTDLRVDPTLNTIEIDFDVFEDRVSSIGGNVKRLEALVNLEMVPRLRARVIPNPVTGDAYLLLDVPPNPPPPPSLGFTPKGHYVASIPSPLSTVENRLPQVMEQAEATLQTLREIVARIPASMDRSDRFFTNVERIMRESELPGLSADLRALSNTTTARMAEIASDIDRVMGDEGTLLKFAEEARATLHEADVPASSRAARDAAERTSLAADDLRRSLPTMRDTLEQLRELARLFEEQPEAVIYGPRQQKTKSR